MITTLALYLLLIRYEQRMKQQEAAILRMVNSFPQPIAIFDIDSGSIYLANKAWNNQLGLAISNISRVLSPHDLKQLQHVAKNSNSGLFAAGVHEFNAVNDAAMFLDTYGFQTNYKGKQVYALLGIDVTNHVQVLSKLMSSEEALLQTRSSLKDVAWMHSHELRKPLANILGLIDLAKVNINDRNTLQQLLQMLKDSATEADEVLKHIVNKTYHLE